MLLTTGIGLGLMGGVTGLTAWQYARTDGLGMAVNAVFASCGLCNRDKVGKPIPWQIKRVAKRENGSQLVMRFPYGKTLTDVVAKTEAIMTALGADVAFARDGGYLLMDILQFPLPTYLPYEMRLLELTRGSWRVPVGRSIEGMVFHDFDAYPHLLVAGPTRGGKTVFLKNVIATLHLSHKASEIEFVGVDMKPYSLGFRKFAGVWNQLASTPEQFLSAIRNTYGLMEKRAETLAKANCENVLEYEQTTGERFKRLFLVVDEYGKSFGSDVEDDITSEMLQLTALGAGLGVHVVLCTQRPDAQVIDGKIKANIEAIVCFGAANGIQSRVILGHEGAEDLPDIRGRAIYQTDREVTLQVPYLSDKKLSKILPNNIPLPVQSRGLAKIGDTPEPVQGLSKIADTPDKPGNADLKRLKARSAPVVRLHD